jgi:hypothetical protein
MEGRLSKSKREKAILWWLLALVLGGFIVTIILSSITLSKTHESTCADPCTDPQSIVLLDEHQQITQAEIEKLRKEVNSLRTGQDGIQSTINEQKTSILNGQANIMKLFGVNALTNETDYLSTTTCCRYTHSDIPTLVDELLVFERRMVLNDNVYFAYVSNDWNDLDTTFNDVETPFVSNTYMQYLVSLRARIQTAIAGNSNTMEDMMLRVFIREIDYYISISQIDALFMQYGIGRWDSGWLYDPWQTAADMIPILLDFTTKPNYATKINTWLQSLDEKMERWSAFAQRAVTNRKTHANVNMRRQYDLGYGPYGYFFAFTIDYTPLCASMTGADRTTCLSRKTSLMSKLSDFHNWWNAVYRPACALNRPDSAPGLWKVPQGDVLYNILKVYHTGNKQNDTAMNALGNQGVQEIFTQYDILRTQIPGKKIDSVAQLITALGNLSDARFTTCTQDPSVAINLTRIDLADIDSKLSALFGFQPRSSLEVTVGGSSSTFFGTGVYDNKKKFWTAAGTYNVGVLGTCGLTGLNKPRTRGNAPPQFLAYDRVGAKSTAVHEGKPGRALQVPLGTEINCGFAISTLANTMFVEGWASHTEFLGNELGVYTTPIEQIGNYRSRALRDNQLREDTCLHSNESTMPVGQRRCTYQQAKQLMIDVGFSESYAEFETERYIIMGAQALGHRLGDIYLQKLRLEAKNAIVSAGYKFDARDFYNVILRFGGGDLAQTLTPLVKTYVKYATNQPILPSDFGSDLIPSQLYSTGNPIIGNGRDNKCVSPSAN